MKIKKIYIQNFKWIKWPKVLDFENDITFLTWPNGFWKTTIFDVIEICITWELYRVTQQPETRKVINWNTDVWKPFYQNEWWRDVIIKILIELENKDKKVIVAYDNHEESKDEKKNKPSKLYFERFIEDYNEDTFWTINFNAVNKITFHKGNKAENNKEINKLLWIEDEKKDISEIYKIFNYLQQEENTYFLKKSEHDRHWSLDFIFWTENEKKKKVKVEKIKNRFKKIHDNLEIESEKRQGEIDEKKKIIEKKEKIKYSNFFKEEDEINTGIVNFDKKDLFSKDLWIQNENYKKDYLNNLINFKDFLNNFDINEYQKSQDKYKLEEISKNNDFLQYFILQKFNSKEEYRKLEDYNDLYNFSNNKQVLDILIYKNFLVKNEYEKIKEKNKLYSLTEESDSIDKNKTFEYYFLQDKINNKEYIEELKTKKNLEEYNNTDKKLLDRFLLDKFIINKNHLEAKYNIYKKINEDEYNTILNWVILKEYYKDNNGLSEYEKLKKKYEKYISLKEYKENDNIKKIEWFKDVFGKLNFNDDELLKKFNKNLERCNELKNDLDKNDKIIKDLNDLKINLLDFFENNLKNTFNDSCILCWTEAVVTWNNQDKIDSFKKFKEIVNEKIINISNISEEQYKLIKDEENKNIEILEIILKKVDEYLEQNKNNILKFKKLKEILTQEQYNTNYSTIEDINIDNKVSFEKNKIWIKDDINLDELNKNILDIKNIILKKYSPHYDLYNKISNIDIDISLKSKNNLKLLLDDEKIDYVIDENNFSIQTYEDKKGEILDCINKYIIGFNEQEYFKIMYFIGLDSLDSYKEDSKRINLFLDEEWRKNDFTLNIDYFIDIIEWKIDELKNYINEKTEKYHKLFLSIYDIEKKFQSINKDKLNKLRKTLEIKEVLENIDEYSKEKSNQLIKELEGKKDNFFLSKNKTYKIIEKLNFDSQDFKFFLEKLNSFNIKELNKYILDENKHDDINSIDTYKTNLKTIIDNKVINLDENIDYTKLWWKNKNIFLEVFWNNLTLVEKYQKDIYKLDNKQKYIEFKYFELENNFLDILKEELKLINTRKKSIYNLNIKFEGLSSIYDEEIKDYKKEMVDAIKLPFFLYTWKILQNFQQWMWIFIDMIFENKDKSQKGKETINFYSSGKSWNDVIHQLSSWQLSVISIAFTLAVNNIYKISNDLKFLNIDDPVQEMDSLNIHSFIELIRHNFEDYNFIISTHSDENAYFMKYKLEKFNRKVNISNIQNEFFKPKLIKNNN